MTLLLSLLLLGGPAVQGRATAGPSLPEGVVACLQPVQSQHEKFIQALAFSPDGKIIASGSYSGLCLWEPDGNEPPRRLTPPNGQPFRYVLTARFMDGGKRLVTGSADESIGTLRYWDPVTGKQLGRGSLGGGLTSLVAFDRSGRTAAVANHGLSFNLVETGTGKELHRCGGYEYQVDGLAVSDDGKLVAASDRWGDLRLWDTATGKERPRLPAAEEARDPALAPDGRRLAANVRAQQLWVWDTATGDVLCQVAVEKPFLFSAFSPDGRVVAVGGKGLIQLFEVATGKERMRLPAGEDIAWRLAFSPDGVRLAVGDSGATVWLYDVSGRGDAGRVRERLSPADLDALWADLASSDAARASRAIRALTDTRASVVGFLSEHLSPATVDAREIARLVKNLDDDSFPVRHKASAALEAMADRAAGELRRTLATGPSLEVRKRLESLLERAGSFTLSNERARELRAVEVLEYVATPEAKKLLEALTKGEPEARLTREAKAALERLDGR